MDDILYSRIKKLIPELDALAAGGKPVCLAIVDADLALIALLRMPGVHPRIELMARGKAYTCAKMGCTTAELNARLHREQLTLADFMDERMTSMRGGVPLLDDKGNIIAGIGISGRRMDEDEALALRVRDFLTAEE
jgi:uncharacterized protein GlcG (DUF336 family)